MDFLQIKYFKIVAHTQNISRAAQILYISQSSLSQTIPLFLAPITVSISTIGSFGFCSMKEVKSV